MEQKKYAKKGECKDKELLSLLHRTVKDVIQDLERMHLNTCISRIMELLNTMYAETERIKKEGLLMEMMEKLLLLLSPFAPHLCEYLWSTLGKDGSVFEESWPQFDEELAKGERMQIVVQVDGKLRDRLSVPHSCTQDRIEELALSSPKVRRFLDGKRIERIIYVQKRLVNIVTKGG
jgi:leucyl-tRNA synthetase